MLDGASKPQNLLGMMNLHTEPIILSGVDNFRDMGGGNDGCGRRVRCGLLFRSAHLSGATNGDIGILSRIGIRTIIDLRRGSEATRAPNRIPPGALERRFTIGREGPSLLEEVARGVKRKMTEADVAESYRHLLDDYAKQYVAIIEALCQPKALPAIISCHAGKDRTGIVAAVILSLLGIERQHIMYDYERSNEGWTLRAARIAAQIRSSVLDFQSVAAAFCAPASAMQSLLNYVEHTHGSAALLLMKAGELDSFLIDRMQELLLTPPSDVEAASRDKS